MGEMIRGVTALMICAGGVFSAVLYAPRVLGAEDFESLGVFGNWIAYAYPTSEGRVCALSSEPEEGRSRTDVYFVVTRQAAADGEAGYELALRAGAPLAKESRPVLEIGEEVFYMFTGAREGGEQAHWAFPENPREEPVILEVMRKGLVLTTALTFEDGAQIEDRYSLTGVTAGLDALEAACP